jgi:hypothetical protein
MQARKAIAAISCMHAYVVGILSLVYVYVMTMKKKKKKKKKKK